MSVGCMQPQPRGHSCSADATYCYLRPSSSPGAPQVRSVVSRRAQSSFAVMDEASRSGRPYRYAGTTWYAACLGPMRHINRAHLGGIGSLVEIGIDNVRILDLRALAAQNSIRQRSDAVGNYI